MILPSSKVLFGLLAWMGVTVPADSARDSRVRIASPVAITSADVVAQVPVVCVLPPDHPEGWIVLEYRAMGGPAWIEGPAFEVFREGRLVNLLFDVGRVEGLHEGERLSLRARLAGAREAGESIVIRLRTRQETMDAIHTEVDRLILAGAEALKSVGDRNLRLGWASRTYGSISRLSTEQLGEMRGLLDSQRDALSELRNLQRRFSSVVVHAACSRVLGHDSAGRLSAAARRMARIAAPEGSAARAVASIEKAIKADGAIRRQELLLAAQEDDREILNAIRQSTSLLELWSIQLEVTCEIQRICRLQDQMNADLDCLSKVRD